MGKSLLDLKRARHRSKEASQAYELRRAQAEEALAATNGRLEALGEQQKQALMDVVVRMADFLRRHERQVRESERLLVDGVDATMGQVPGLRSLDVDTATWIGGALGSAAAGAGAGIGVTAAASSFGVASTGARPCTGRSARRPALPGRAPGSSPSTWGTATAR
ncbi:hypothetical protein [Streptomyces nigra]